MDKISIIVPVYNVATYIRECLGSIQRQTHRNLEIVLVDDGSSDESGKICDEFSMNDPRIVCIHQKNGGVSSARNAGLDFATGDYIGFIDPDDYIATDFYTKLYDSLKAEHADLAVSGITHIYENGNILNPLLSSLISGNPAIYKSKHDILNWIFLGQFNVTAWDKLYRRELWGNARFPIGINLGEDMAIIPAICAGAKRVTRVPEAMYYYRCRKMSLSIGAVTLDRFYQYLEGAEIMRHNLTNREPEMESLISWFKLIYDIGAYKEFLRSSNNTGETGQKKGSTLHRLMAHIKDSRKKYPITENNDIITKS